MSKGKKKNDPVVLFLDLIILVLVYVMIVAGIRFYYHMHYEKWSGTFMQEASVMSFDLEKNNYADLIQGSYVNQINDYHDTQQYHDLAAYTEAAFYYKVYVAKGKEEEAAREKDIMNESRNAMGSLTVFADRVDTMIQDFGKK